MKHRKKAIAALLGGAGLTIWALAGRTPAPSPSGLRTPVIAPIYSDRVNAELGIGGKQGGLLDKGFFVINYSADWKIPFWVAEHITREDLSGKAKRKNDFRPDPELPESLQSQLSDYRGSGQDRGHNSPAGDFTRNKEAMSLTFLLSNMSPQVPNLNRKSWQRFESAVRDSVKKYGRAWIVTGNIVQRNHLSIGTNKVAVPSLIFKTILCLSDDGEYVGFAGLGKNDDDDPSVLFTNIDEVEAMSDFDFYCLLDDSLEERIESGN